MTSVVGDLGYPVFLWTRLMGFLWISLAISTSAVKELDETMEKLKVVVEDRSLAPIVGAFEDK